MQHLCVGILAGNPGGWAILLQQEGIPFQPVADEPAIEQFSVIAAGNDLTPTDMEWLRTYLKSGGAVLCSGRTYTDLINVRSKMMPIKYVLGEEGTAFDNLGLLDLYTRCYVPDGANMLRTNNDKRAAFIGESLGGSVVVLPFDPSQLILDRRTATKSFYAGRKRLPFEFVSLVAKGNLRRLVSRSLEILHHTRGIPFVHSWYYSSDAQTLFSFRIDTDYAGKDEIERLYNLVHRHSIPATWFVDVKSQHNILSIFKQMKNQEIGVHCYEHRTFDEYKRNLDNIHRAIELIQQVGLKAEGFAAPYGRWNDGIGRAVSECGFEFSSEFSYDYDNLPSFPLVGSTASSALQVPVHPISIGSLRRQGFSEEDMIGYFRRVLDEKLRAREPIFLYHHPNNGHERVLEFVFDWIHKHNVPTLRMIDYARWWRKRLAVALEIEASGLVVRPTSRNASDDVWMRITRADRTERFSAPNEPVDLSSNDWHEQPKPVPLPSDVHRIRKFNPWIPLVRTEDYVFGKLLRHR